ncbi:hypothetical protein QTP88_025295 [Uroleucon formosanum]
MHHNSITNKSLLILLFNANGLKNHDIELQNVLNNKRIDIALITETLFTKYSTIHIPGYKLLKTNHPDGTAHGGVAILIKSSVLFELLPNFCLDHLQSCAIIVKLNNISITIAAIYSPPKHKLTVNHYANYFNTVGNNFLIGGDFNAKHHSWGCRANNPRGSVLYNFVSQKNFKVLAPPPPWPNILADLSSLSYFPLIWKFSIIILVPKPNKPPDSTSSFRPISLLPFFAKILERLLLKRILPSVTSNSILPDSQFGFRNAHSTIHQAHRLIYLRLLTGFGMMGSYTN